MRTKSEYRIYLYLNRDETFEARITSLVEKYGVDAPQIAEVRKSVDYRESVDKIEFIRLLREGIYSPHWEEFPMTKWQRLQNLFIALAKDEWEIDFTLALRLEPLYSPILQNSNVLTILGENGAQKFEALSKSSNQITNDFGIDLPHPVQKFQEGKIIVLTIGGHALTSGMNVHNFEPINYTDMVWIDRQNLLKDMLKILNPFFGFVTDYVDERGLSISRRMTTWPPLEPWKFFWRLMVFGGQLSQTIGVGKLRSTPAFILEELGENLFWIQPTDALHHDYFWKSPQLTYSQHKEYEKSVIHHLDLIDPYD